MYDWAAMNDTSRSVIDEFHLIHPEHYAAHGYPHDVWKRLRADDPVHWFDRTEGKPFWCITKHADIVTIGKRPEQFLNGPRLVLSHLPELMQSERRPSWGSREQALRTARASRLSERRALAALHRIPGAKKARRILDVGCGEAHMLAALLARYRDALGTGVELDARVAERAQETLEAAHVQRRGEIRSGDFFAAQLPHAFDLALLNNNLHYFEEARWPGLFARIADHLAPDGLVAIQTPLLVDGTLARMSGARATLATFDLFLRAHANLSGLPDLARLEAALRGAGFAQVGTQPVLPGGSLCFVWARMPAR